MSSSHYQHQQSRSATQISASTLPPPRRNLNATPHRQPVTPSALPRRNLQQQQQKTPSRIPTPSTITTTTTATTTPHRLPRRAISNTLKTPSSALKTPSSLRPPRRACEPRTPSFHATDMSSSSFREIRHYHSDDDDDDVNDDDNRPMCTNNDNNNSNNIEKEEDEEREEKSEQSPGYVPLNEDAIAATPRKEDNDRWLQNFGIDINVLKIVDEKYSQKLDEENAPSVLELTGLDSMAHTPSLSSRRRRIPNDDDDDEECSPPNLNYNNNRENNDNNNMTFHTLSSVVEKPGPTSSTRVLFADDVQPQTATKTKTPLSKIPRPPRSISFANPSLSSPSSSSSHSLSKDDISTATTNSTSTNNITTPKTNNNNTNVTSSRRRRRRVSIRELRQLGSTPSPSTIPSNKKQANTDTGSNIFLKPVRASRRQREELGSNTVVTPVRRSLRLSRRHIPPPDEQTVQQATKCSNDEVPVAPAPHQDERAKLLSKSQYAYAPNPNL